MDEHTHLEMEHDPRLDTLKLRIRIHSKAGTPGISDDDLRQFVDDMDQMPVRNPLALKYRRAMRYLADDQIDDAIALASQVAQEDPAIYGIC